MLAGAGAERSASVVADTPVRCLIISRALFATLLPELRTALVAAVRRYGHDDPETLSLTRHIHMYRRVALSVSAPGTRDRDSLLKLMSAFAPGKQPCRSSRVGGGACTTSFGTLLTHVIPSRPAPHAELNVEDVLERLVAALLSMFAVERVAMFLLDRCAVDSAAAA